MKSKRFYLLLPLLLALALLLGGCADLAYELSQPAATTAPAPAPTLGLTLITDPPETLAPRPTETPTPTPAPEVLIPRPTETETPTAASVAEDGEYTSPEEVAAYLHLYGHLPGNFLTKSEAQALGWDSSRGNLWDVAPGKSIGGDRFGNYEGNLPRGNYRECDVNYAGGYRGAERLIYGRDGSIYYTDDHYNTFTQLY